MNYMPEVLEMLGLEVGEKFEIKRKDPSFATVTNVSFGENFTLTNKYGYKVTDGIELILTGEYEIEKLPWKPEKDDIYYFITESGHVTTSQFFLRTFDYNNYNYGNCFKTSEEITEEIKQRILSEMKGKYENDI